MVAILIAWLTFIVLNHRRLLDDINRLSLLDSELVALVLVVHVGYVADSVW